MILNKKTVKIVAAVCTLSVTALLGCFVMYRRRTNKDQKAESTDSMSGDKCCDPCEDNPDGPQKCKFDSDESVTSEEISVDKDIRDSENRLSNYQCKFDSDVSVAPEEILSVDKDIRDSENRLSNYECKFDSDVSVAPEEILSVDKDIRDSENRLSNYECKFDSDVSVAPEEILSVDKDIRDSENRLSNYECKFDSDVSVAPEEILSVDKDIRDSENRLSNYECKFDSDVSVAPEEILSVDKDIRDSENRLSNYEERLNVEATIEDTELRQLLRKLPDFQRLVEKFIRKTASLQDCYRVYQAVKNMPHLLETLESHTGPDESLLMELFNSAEKALLTFSKYQTMIETFVDLAQVEKHQFVIKPDYSQCLKDIRQKIDRIEDDIKLQLNMVAKDLDIQPNKIKLEFNPELGYLFRVTRKDEKALRNNTHYNVIDTEHNGVHFNNKALNKLNEEYLHNTQYYVEIQKFFETQLIDTAAAYVEPMLEMHDIIDRLNVLVSFTHVSVSTPNAYIIPKLLSINCTTTRIALDSEEKNPVNILNALHPRIKHELVNEYGQSHSKMFVVQTVLDGNIFKSIGITKKQAKSKAAAAALFKVYRIYV